MLDEIQKGEIKIFDENIKNLTREKRELIKKELGGSIISVWCPILFTKCY